MIRQTPYVHTNTDILLDQDVMAAPEWLSDEDCQQELGSDWCRRGIEQSEDGQ